MEKGDENRNNMTGDRQGDVKACSANPSSEFAKRPDFVASNMRKVTRRSSICIDHPGTP
jgi:hypothetical protein